MRRGVSDKMRDSDPQTQMVVPIENIEKYAETRFHEIFLDICVFETIVGRGFDWEFDYIWFELLHIFYPRWNGLSEVAIHVPAWKCSTSTPLILEEHRLR